MRKKFEILNTIYKNCSLSSKEILVAQYFIYRSNTQGICYPAVETIAEECGVSKRTVQRATKKLQERGYIIISKRTIKGKQSSNLYQIMDTPSEERDMNILEDIVDEDKKDAFAMTVVSLDDILSAEPEWEEIQKHDTPFTEKEINICNDDSEILVNAEDALKGEVCPIEDAIGADEHVVSVCQAVERVNKRHKNIGGYPYVMFILARAFLFIVYDYIILKLCVDVALDMLLVKRGKMYLCISISQMQRICVIFLKLGVPP